MGAWVIDKQSLHVAKYIEKSGSTGEMLPEMNASQIVGPGSIGCVCGGACFSDIAQDTSVDTKSWEVENGSCILPLCVEFLNKAVLFRPAQYIATRPACCSVSVGVDKGGLRMNFCGGYLNRLSFSLSRSFCATCDLAQAPRILPTVGPSRVGI